MSGIERTDLDQHMDRLVRLTSKLGPPCNWELVEGDAEASPRTPWVIEEHGVRLLTLGYTRRAALSALSAMNNYAAAILGA